MTYDPQLLDELARVYVEAALRRLESEMATEGQSGRKASPADSLEGQTAKRIV